MLIISFTCHIHLPSCDLSLNATCCMAMSPSSISSPCCGSLFAGCNGQQPVPGPVVGPTSPLPDYSRLGHQATTGQPAGRRCGAQEEKEASLYLTGWAVHSGEYRQCIMATLIDHHHVAVGMECQLLAVASELPTRGGENVMPCLGEVK